MKFKKEKDFLKKQQPTTNPEQSIQNLCHNASGVVQLAFTSLWETIMHIFSNSLFSDKELNWNWP